MNLRPVWFLLACFGLQVNGFSALQWHNETGFRWSELPIPTEPAAQAGFTLLPGQTTGLLFTNRVDESAGAANRVLYNGAGVAAGDFDNDGLPDIFLCDESGHNALFKNLGGWKFKDVSAEAGLGMVVPQTRGAVFADLNGDGWLDLLIPVTGRGVLCFLNDGKGHFQEFKPCAQMLGNYGSTSLALADIDGNGTLDLYIVNYRPDDVRDLGRVNMSLVNGRPILAGAETNRFLLINGNLAECGQPDLLLLNDGHANLKPVSWTDGTFLDEAGQKLSEPPLDWGLTATFRDANGDLAPDLYVCNDYWTPDRFWINDGKGHFRALPALAMRKSSASSMSVDFADIDRDGTPDFFVVDMLSRFPAMRKRQGFAQMPTLSPVGVITNRPQVMRNTLFLGRPDGTYAEIAFYAHVPASDWSWAPMFLDVDLDGYEDLLVGAGHFRDVQDYDAEQQIRALQHSWEGYRNETERRKAYTRELMEHYHLYPLLQMPIGAFRNNGNCTFSEVANDWGLSAPGVHQGMALADFDQDGRLDLVVNNLNGPATLFRNTTTAPRVAVRLKGRTPNTQAIGAKVSLFNGAVPKQSSEIVCGGHYQSGSDTELVFGAGAAKEGMKLEVRWRTGGRTVLEGIRANRIYEIDESSSTNSSSGGQAPQKTEPTPLFQDVTSRLAHRHFQAPYDDFERQPLLPFKLSQLGPGVAWFDLDGDGHDDLIIGTGRGGTPTAFHSDGHGQFVRLPSDTSLVASNDTCGLVGWQDPSGARRILAGLSGYEIKTDNASLSMAISASGLERTDSFRCGMTSAGALAMGDINGDGHLALFVAGGVIPGQYPKAAPSKLFKWMGGGWQADERNSQLFANVGIVNGAVWSDLDGDGFPELILACEWGPIRVFRARSGQLSEITSDLGLSKYIGWWRGVTTADLNNDGRMDIIASNWGLNSPYQATEKEPLTFYYGELAQPGVIDVIETEYDHGALVPSRQLMALTASMPFLLAQFPSQKAYSEATAQQVLGERKVLARTVSANTLASMVFINTGKGFKPMELPREAQFAPAFSLNVADFDGDGNEDVFLSQNFSDTRPEDSRIDAGLGLWLRGDGAGGLAPVPAEKSGLNVYGEQRGAALCDFDEDGRVDLVVTQNGAATRLFHNVGATPGLRVKLKGPPGNPDGINAVMWLKFKDHNGPAREVHGGSGYWSEDSLVQVLAMPIPAEQLVVRWPGGHLTTTPLVPGTKQILVDSQERADTPRP